MYANTANQNPAELGPPPPPPPMEMTHGDEWTDSKHLKCFPTSGGADARNTWNLCAQILHCETFAAQKNLDCLSKKVLGCKWMFALPVPKLAASVMCDAKTYSLSDLLQAAATIVVASGEHIRPRMFFHFCSLTFFRSSMFYWFSFTRFFDFGFCSVLFIFIPFGLFSFLSPMVIFQFKQLPLDSTVLKIFLGSHTCPINWAYITTIVPFISHFVHEFWKIFWRFPCFVFETQMADFCIYEVFSYHGWKHNHYGWYSAFYLQLPPCTWGTCHYFSVLRWSCPAFLFLVETCPAF